SLPARRGILGSPDGVLDRDVRGCRDDRRMTGKQVKLFLADGTPGGLTTAEITNWTGSIVSARRSDLAELLAREEAERTGVYLLLGEDEDAVGDTRCYIGEADTVATRLRAHAKEKPFWN